MTADPPAPRSDTVRFAHHSERQFARLLDFYQIEWEYEPTSFDLEWDKEGNVVQKCREMGSAFFMCPEYSARNTSNSQFVTDLYRALLWREPDPGGHAFWVQQVPQMGRYNVMLNFLYSSEYYSTTVSVLY